MMRYDPDVRSILLALILIVPSTRTAALAEAPRAQTLFAGGHWAALQFGRQCVAEARPLLPAAKRHPAARAGVSFSNGRTGFHARLSRSPRAESSVMLTVGDRPFLLVRRGDWAWSSGPKQDLAIIVAMRNGRSMRIESRDERGRRFTDRYLLDGAPTAIDAAAAGCAGKI